MESNDLIVVSGEVGCDFFFDEARIDVALFIEVVILWSGQNVSIMPELIWVESTSVVYGRRGNAI